jgi:hypothetical protein
LLSFGTKDNFYIDASWQLGVRQPDKEEEAGESYINSMNFDLKLKVR